MACRAPGPAGGRALGGAGAGGGGAGGAVALFRQAVVALAQRLLHDDHIQPAAEFEPRRLHHAHTPEAGRHMQADGAGILAVLHPCCLGFHGR